MTNRPATTGPDQDPDRYHVADPRQFVRGGVGLVYRAWQCREGNEDDGTDSIEVGLKMLTGMDDARIAKLRQRSSRLHEVIHPHLARHVECFAGPPPVASLSGLPRDSSDHVWYAVHEWVPGHGLADVLTDANQDQIERWMEQLASGLDALHGAAEGGLAHRDVHLRNVVITEDDDAVLIDYDTVLSGDATDTQLISLRHRVRSTDSSLESAKANDRSAFALLCLRVLAKDADEVLTVDGALAAARERLGTRRVRATLGVLGRCVERPPASCGAIIDHWRAGRRRRRATWVAGLGAAAAACAAVAAVWTYGDAPPAAQADGPPPTADRSSGTGPSLLRASPTLPEGVRIDASLTLDESNFCRWLYRDNPIPLVSLDPLVMRVDARCNYPSNPDPLTDPGARLFSTPSNDDPMNKLSRVRDGESIEPVCFVVDGDLVNDGYQAAELSPLWVYSSRPRGYIPNVNIGGGYTEAQLRGLGLVACPA